MGTEGRGRVEERGRGSAHRNVFSDISSVLDYLKERKIKVTLGRRRILERFLDTSSPWTLQSLHINLEGKGNFDLSTVFRALETFKSIGILEEFHLPDDKQTYYSLADHPNHKKDVHHHHIVCKNCKEVEHLEVCLPAIWLNRIQLQTGYKITDHRLEFKGICGNCR